MLRREQRIALYMEGASNDDIGKMGFGVLRYASNPIVCVVDSQASHRDMRETGRVDRSCPIVATVSEAVAMGADVLVLGTAPPGGLIPEAWWPDLHRAVESGMSLINGLHDLLAPHFPELAPGQYIWDVRVEPSGLGVATGAAAKLRAKRVLMIGTDMAVGKMTAGLELLREARERGKAAEFVATGQIGITITGHGVPLDAVRVDFASGSIEREVLRAAGELPGGDGLVIVEGQGALIHPGSTANLPLLRGSCPTHLILCHRAGQTHLKRVPDIPIPPLREYVRLYEDVASACGTFPRPTTVAVALNSAHLDAESAHAAARAVEDETGLPCVDPVRDGAGRLVDALGL